MNRPLARQLRRNLGNIVSNHIIASELVTLLREEFSNGGDASVLDLGAGSRPYATLYEAFFTSSTSVDVAHTPHDLRGIDVIASADDLPFADESYDLVICTEVLEHCRRPQAVLSEIRRVLKPGGTCFLTTPFLRPLHELPYDFYRFTPPALEHLAAEAGLRVISLRPRGDYWGVALLVVQLPLTKFWQQLSKVLGVNLYRPANPLVLLPIVAPQLAYLAYWHFVTRRQGGALHRFQSKFSHYALGFVTILRR